MSTVFLFEGSPVAHTSRQGTNEISQRVASGGADDTTVQVWQPV
ncbi:MAG TPA: hypothetical protein VGN32_04595 [Ktedonobacterales bacterium]|nr:hypothetical protein [Ktedonobacterales bacterium]